MIALPLLFTWPNDKKINILTLATDGVGALFIGIFLSAYLAGIPTTAVFHSDPTVRLALAITGTIFLILVLTTIITAVLKRNNR